LQHGAIPYPEVAFQEQNVCQENENVCQENENVCHENVYREPVAEKQIIPSQISESEIYQRDTFHSHQPQYSILPNHLDDHNHHGLQSQDITQQLTRQHFPNDQASVIIEGTDQLPVPDPGQMSEQGSVASSSCHKESSGSSNPLVQFRGLWGPLLDTNLMQPSTPLGSHK
jgi:hypothetical protein